jgi:Golgi nucleoside diphosphatase
LMILVQGMNAKRFKLVGILFAASVLAGCGGGGTSPNTYTAVVDAGSNGSRIYLYKSTPDASFVNVEQLYTNKDAPHGLSWYDGSQGAGGVSTNAGPEGIRPLLVGLKDYLDSHGIATSQVPVNVLATAGMRLVSPEISAEIYESVKKTITTSGFSYRQVGTISGQSEGLYSWANANFLQGNFHTHSPTQGIVEVGGASSQVAFVTEPNNDDSHVLTTRVNGVSYPVFSISYLGLGTNQVRLSMINTNSSGGTQANVCYPNNTTGAPTLYDAATGGIVVNAVTSSYTAACYSVYENVIGNVSVNTDNNFAIGRIAQQSGYAATQFLGISAAYYAHKEWGAIGSANAAQALQDTLSDNCTGSNAWIKVLTQYNGDASAFTQNGCANSTYIHAYLYSNQALGISPTKLTPVATINGNELTWTRGFVVVNAL